VKKEAAVLATMRFLLDGRSREEVEVYLRSERVKDPGKVIEEAKRRFQLVADEPPRTRLGFCQAAALTLYQRTLEVGDHPSALRALQELAKLSNAYQVAKESTPADEGEDLDGLLQVIQGGGGRGE